MTMIHFGMIHFGIWSLLTGEVIDLLPGCVPKNAGLGNLVFCVLDRREVRFAIPTDRWALRSEWPRIRR